MRCRVHSLYTQCKEYFFYKVISKIEEVVGPLKAYQVDFGCKKAYFGQSFDKTEDEAKVLVHRILGHKDTLEDHEEQLSNMDDRIAVVQKSIFKLDVSVAKASEIRQTQHWSCHSASQQCSRDADA